MYSSEIPWKIRFGVELNLTYLQTWITTGCPAKLFSLFYKQFLGLWWTKDFNLGHFLTALSVGCSKSSKILKIEQHLNKLWTKYWQRIKTKSNKIQVQLKYFFCSLIFTIFMIPNWYNNLYFTDSIIFNIVMISVIDTVSSLCPAIKWNCFTDTGTFKNARNVALPSGTQRKGGVLIPHSQVGPAVWWEINTV